VDEFDRAKSTGAAPAQPEDETPCLADGRTYLDDEAPFTLSFEADAGATIVVFYTLAEDGSLDIAVGYDQADCALLVTYP
jgi:hypothetical protein